jgi:hypothetical protein
MGQTAMNRFGMNVHPYFAASQRTQLGGRKIRRLGALQATRATNSQWRTALLRTGFAVALALCAGGGLAALLVRLAHRHL